MPVTINGTTGIVTPAENTSALTVGSITGILKASSGVVSQAVAGTDYGQLTLATAQTASGTSVDFTGIPSWVKRITVIFNTVSTNGTSNFLIRLGSGSIDVSSYESSAEYAGIAATDSTGLVIRNSGAANAHQGLYTLSVVSTNLWIGSGIVRPGISGGTGTGGSATGYKPVTSTLDRIRITTVNGTDTFDAGTINISYE